jgi:hypothetical protein
MKRNDERIPHKLRETLVHTLYRLRTAHVEETREENMARRDHRGVLCRIFGGHGTHYPFHQGRTPPLTSRTREDNDAVCGTKSL